MVQHKHYNQARDKKKRKEISQHQCNVNGEVSKNHSQTNANGNNTTQLQNNYNRIPLRDASQVSSIACTSNKSSELNFEVGPTGKMNWITYQRNSWLGPHWGTEQLGVAV